MRLSLENTLAIKITLISVAIIAIILAGVMSLQYQFVQHDARIAFKKETQEYEKTILSSKILSQDISAQIQKSRDTNEYDGILSTLIQSIVMDTTGQVIINDYYPHISESEMQILKRLPERQITPLSLQGESILVYKFSEGGYSVITSQYLYNGIFDYYSTLIQYLIIGSIVIIIILYGVSLYFAHISIKPIREHNSALESYNRNLAHEMRTPLSVIRGDLDMLELTGDQRFIGSSRDEIKNMEQIIESLLFIAKPKSEQIHQKDINIIEIINDCIDRYSDISIVFRHNTQHYTTHADPELLTRIICNLIDNAIKYGTGGIDIQLSGQALMITNPVLHNLSKKEIQHLTELFYQVDTSRHSEGYGLGLTMVKKICEVFDWKLNISCKNQLFRVEIKMK